MHVVLAGGGTAGHVEPAMNLADALRARDPDIGITALGTAEGLETRLVPERGYTLALIPRVPLPRRPSVDLLTLPVRLRSAVRAAGDVLSRTGADAVVGFGGFVALPAYLAARRAGVPVVVHEANARPGLANRVGARFAAAVAETVPGSGLPGARLTGVPLRAAIRALDRAAVRPEGRHVFGLPAEGPVLLVVGGSQGARRLNLAVGQALPRLLAAGVSVLHSVGAKAVDAPDPAVDAEGGVYRQLPYIDRMDLAYAAADLVLCRAGMMTVAEVSAVGLPAVFVPLPIGNGEQRLNAQPVVSAGGGILVDDELLDGARLCADVLPLLVGPGDALRRMAGAARTAAMPDAADRLADLVLAAASTAPTRKATRS